MSKFEYKAVPAPDRGTKAKGAKTTEDRFALSITDALNEMAAEGWEYVRAETLPCSERKGLGGTHTSYQNILIFKRFRQEVQPLPLDPRTTSRPLPVEPGADGPASERVVSEPVVPRRVTSHPAGEEHHAPPLGAAREET